MRTNLSGVSVIRNNRCDRTGRRPSEASDHEEKLHHGVIDLKDSKSAHGGGGGGRVRRRGGEQGGVRSVECGGGARRRGERGDRQQHSTSQSPHRGAGRLNQEDVGVSNVLSELDVTLAIVETTDSRLQVHQPLHLPAEQRETTFPKGIPRASETFSASSGFALRHMLSLAVWILDASSHLPANNLYAVVLRGPEDGPLVEDMVGVIPAQSGQE